MFSLFLLAVSFTAILSMDTEVVEDSSSDPFGILDEFLRNFPPSANIDDQRTSDFGNQNLINEVPHTDVQAGAVDTGTSHEDDIHEDEESQDRIKMLKDKLQQLKGNTREKMKKQIGKKIYKIIVKQIKKEGKLQLVKLNFKLRIESDFRNRFLDLLSKLLQNGDLTKYQQKKQEIEKGYQSKLDALEDDLEQSLAKLDQKLQESLHDIVKFVIRNLCSMFRKRSEVVVCIKSLKTDIQKEIEEEMYDLLSVVNVPADQQHIQKVSEELRDYIERTSKPPINVIGLIANNLYKPFIKYAKEVNYHGKKSDKVLKIHCSNLIDDNETAEKCRDIREAMFWMLPKDIKELYHLHKKHKHQK